LARPAFSSLIGSASTALNARKVEMPAERRHALRRESIGHPGDQLIPSPAG
jgi:hypothetical protein